MIPAMQLTLNKWGAISPGDIEGTGLGLSITRGLAKLHGRTVTIKSTVGQGTVVTVILPAHRVMLPPRPRDVTLARANLR